MKVTLISHTQEPEKIIATAAKLCYSDLSIEDILYKYEENSCKDFIKMLINLGHESPFEHVSFTFSIEGVSRVFLAQITRHRIASYSVQSQRYVKEKKFEFIIPPQISNISEAKEEFLSLMKASENCYNKLSKILEEKFKDEKTKLSAQKKAIEDARYALLGAAETKMICTFNARSLLNFFKLRCCGRAQWEIREVAILMLKITREILPSVFNNAGPSCVNGNCDQGNMNCGEKFKI